MTTTTSGAYVVFRGRDAGSPQMFRAGSWYFEPNDPHGGDDRYSEPYETPEAALAAAEEWEARQDWEAGEDRN